MLSCAKNEIITSDIVIHNELEKYIISEQGVYGGIDEVKVFKEDVYVKTDGVVLKNMKIEGNLILSEKIGEGDIEFQNLDVSNAIYIYGGQKPMEFNKVKSLYMIINNDDELTEIIFDKESNVGTITLQSSSNLKGYKFQNLIIDLKDLESHIDLDGIFKKVEVKKTAQINTTYNTVIDEIVINEEAEKTRTFGEGSMIDMEANAEFVVIDNYVLNVYTNNDNVTSVVIDEVKYNMLDNRIDLEKP
jgi:hypothetical protein